MWANFRSIYSRLRKKYDNKQEKKETTAPILISTAAQISILTRIPTLTDSQLSEERIDKLEIPLNDRIILCEMSFDVGNVIGSGAHSYVYNGVCNDRTLKTYRIDENNWRTESLMGKQFAVKFFEFEGYREYNSARIMSQLQHPYIVEVIFVTNIKYKRLYIFMEFADMGSLKDLVQDLKDVSKIFSERQTQKFVNQLSSGLKYLHDRRISDGDIHWGNVLLFSKIDPTGDLVAKWSDFGMSTMQSLTINDMPQIGGVFFDISEYTHFQTFHIQDDIEDMTYRLRSREFLRIRELYYYYANALNDQVLNELYKALLPLESKEFLTPNLSINI
jgi:serine/threonine protein kinase